MPTRYLFQIDGSKDNDKFFKAVRTSPSFGFRGVDLKIGAGPWIPDLVQVEIGKSDAVLTLIELEDKKSDALAACRKYIPEDPREVLCRFNEYLDRVIEECRSHADGRESEFARLKEMLGGVRIDVHTAGALRSSVDIIEEWPIGQGGLSDPPHVQQKSGQDTGKENEPDPFEGTRGLSAEKVNALGRCVMVLDAVIRLRDHSEAEFHNWRMKAPLKSHPRTKESPVLSKLVLKTDNRGMELDFENLIEEILAIWQEPYPHLQRDGTRVLIRNYFQEASQIKSHERMTTIFAAARKHVAGIESPEKSWEGNSTSS